MGFSVNTPIDNATADVTSPVTQFGRFHTKLAAQLLLSGSLSAGTIDLQGSLDGETFDTSNALATFQIGTDASGSLKYVVDKCIAAYRVVATGITGTGSFSVLVGVDETG